MEDMQESRCTLLHKILDHNPSLDRTTPLLSISLQQFASAMYQQEQQQHQLCRTKHRIRDAVKSADGMMILQSPPNSGSATMQVFTSGVDQMMYRHSEPLIDWWLAVYGRLLPAFRRRRDCSLSRVLELNLCP